MYTFMSQKILTIHYPVLFVTNMRVTMHYFAHMHITVHYFAHMHILVQYNVAEVWFCAFDVELVIHDALALYYMQTLMTTSTNCSLSNAYFIPCRVLCIVLHNIGMHYSTVDSTFSNFIFLKQTPTMSACKLLLLMSFIFYTSNRRVFCNFLADGILWTIQSCTPGSQDWTDIVHFTQTFFC
jgi:hypothetical protein